MGFWTDRLYERAHNPIAYAPIFVTYESTADEAANMRVLVDRRVDGMIVNCAVGLEAYGTDRKPVL